MQKHDISVCRKSLFWLFRSKRMYSYLVIIRFIDSLIYVMPFAQLYIFSQKNAIALIIFTRSFHKKFQSTKSWKRRIIKEKWIEMAEKSEVVEDTRYQNSLRCFKDVLQKMFKIYWQCIYRWYNEYMNNDSYIHTLICPI